MKDKAIEKLIREEAQRQEDGLELIPSENYVSKDVLEALGSILTNKYSEGYPKKRYYGGNEFVDEIELLAQARAKKLFGVPHANVQPYSGSPANFAAYVATCNPGDTIMGLNLPDGGHLTHGWKVSVTSLFYKSVPYHVREDGRADVDEARRLAKEHKPKLIWCGGTAYSYEYEFEQFAEIAEEVGAYFAADIAHVAGLVIAGAHKSPVPYAHIVTTTTHKTLRGPRGGMIMVTEKGIAKDPELPEKIDRAVFPALQGGPHDHQTAAIAVALEEASTPEFRAYGNQIVLNAKRLAAALVKRGLRVVGGGTENHLLRLDLVPVFGPGGGVFASDALGAAGMTVNKNTIPQDPGSPFYPSGIRLGTPAITSRGMKEEDMERIGEWIAKAIFEVKQHRLPEDKEGRQAHLAAFRQELRANKTLASMRDEIREFCKKFPVPA